VLKPCVSRVETVHERKGGPELKEPGAATSGRWQPTAKMGGWGAVRSAARVCGTVRRQVVSSASARRVACVVVG